MRYSFGNSCWAKGLYQRQQSDIICACKHRFSISFIQSIYHLVLCGGITARPNNGLNVAQTDGMATEGSHAIDISMFPLMGAVWQLSIRDTVDCLPRLLINHLSIELQLSKRIVYCTARNDTTSYHNETHRHVTWFTCYAQTDQRRMFTQWHTCFIYQMKITITIK